MKLMKGHKNMKNLREMNILKLNNKKKLMKN